MHPGEIYQFCNTKRLAVLSTISPDGTSQSALVGFAITPKLQIVFDTQAGTRKYRNLLRNPRCSFVIGWDSETTVQYEGIARIPEGPELDEFRAVYFNVFYDGPMRLNWPGITHFVVEPKWVRYSDYDKMPALIQEFTFE